MAETDTEVEQAYAPRPDPYASVYAPGYMPLMIRNEEEAKRMQGEYRERIAQRDEERKKAQDAQQLNVDQMSKILDEAASNIRRMRKPNAGMALLSLGANMMGPGDFGTQVGRGLRAMSGTLQQQQEEEAQGEKDYAGIQMQRATLQNMPIAERLKYIQALQQGDIAGLRALEQAQLRNAPKAKDLQPKTVAGMIYDPATGKFTDPTTGESFHGGDSTITSSGEQINQSALPQAPGETDDQKKILADIAAKRGSAYAETVRAVARGERMFPADRGKLSRAQLSLFEDAKHYDPSFSTMDYNQRANTLKSFTSGKDADSIAAMNTAIGHMGTLLEKARNLPDVGSQHVNAAINAIKTEFGGTGATDFATVAHPVAEEISRVFKGGNLSDAEIHAWADKLKPGMTKGQIDAAITDLQEMMQSRIAALGEKYNRGMGRNAKPMDFIDPHSREIIQHMRDNPLVPRQPQDGGKPPSSTSPSGRDQTRYSEGQTATGPNGAKMIFKGGRWQPVQ